MDEMGWRWTLGQAIQWQEIFWGHHQLARISRTVNYGWKFSEYNWSV
jgi:hypothetical protein